MNLEQQVVSLDLAKRLKELGVKQESVCYWAERYQLDDIGRKVVGVRFSTNPDFSGTTYSYFHEQDICAAFTVAELGEMLPWLVEKNGEMYWSELIKNGPKSLGAKTWEVFYKTCEDETGDVEILRDFTASADTEADARAKMLIYLIENKLITV